LSTHDEPTLVDVNLVGNAYSPSNWAHVEYEELKGENELFKQELQSRELTIHTLRSELQDAELLVQHAEEQLQEQTNQLDEQLKDERARLALSEQDYRKLKQELNYVHEEYHKHKQTHLLQLNERERELERLRLQLTAKTINHVNDDELEKRLQTLTESLIHKQTIIESLQTDKSSLSMQLERLEKRLDDYEKISSTTTNNSLQQSSRRLQTTAGSTTINMDMDNNGIYDNDHEDSIRFRLPLLREKPYDPDITKKVKRAATEIDKLGIRLGVFLKRYPAVRLGVIFYAILLHLWTLIVLFTYTPEVHGNIHPLDMSHKT
jgi:chromosome segregation ATPase